MHLSDAQGLPVPEMLVLWHPLYFITLFFPSPTSCVARGIWGLQQAAVACLLPCHAFLTSGTDALPVLLRRQKDFTH